MRFLLSAVLFLATFSQAMAADRPAARANNPAKTNRLICKTGSENRSSNQQLELYFQYYLPILFEAEDPTVPFGRQVMVLTARPLVQMHFRKSAEAAGENGEKLEPMTCAFAKRPLNAGEPNHAQIYLPAGQAHWLSQAIGQRPGPKQLSFERAVIAPVGDWSFASQFDKVFALEIDDMKSFTTTQLPKAL